jgi:hypothetical protein
MKIANKMHFKIYYVFCIFTKQKATKTKAAIWFNKMYR